MLVDKHGTSPEVALVLEAIEAWALRLQKQASLGIANALLATIGPDYVLPAPAAAISAVESCTPCSIDPDDIFMSSEAVRIDGAAMFAPVVAADVHPLRLEAASWAPSGSGNPAVRIDLSRTGHDRLVPGWLWINLVCGPSIEAALEGRVFASAGHRGLRVRRGTDAVLKGLVDVPARSPVVSRLIALCRGLLLVEVPRALCDEDHLTLSLELETPFVACGAVPGVEVNAIPFWDSRAASYPPPSDVIQTVFEGRDRSLHRLSVVGPDSATPWCITKAFPSLRPEHSLERAGSITDSVSAWTYSLHLVEREPGFRARPGVLAIRIDEKVRQELDARQEHLAATYRTTTGSRANGIATGTRFNVVDPLRKIGHVTARLLTPSWGGSDGMMGQGNADGVGPALGAARDRGVRTVGDFQLILESHFDDELELVTPRELVRVHPESFGSVLCVRLRFRHALRTRRERTIILFACQHFFKRYLGSQCPDGLVFHDVDDEEAT